MSKRGTFTKNILTLTRKRSLALALDGWRVHDRIRLTRKGRIQTCELCGTRFQRGGVVVYPPRKVTIAIGGDCLRTLLAQRFADRQEIARSRRKTTLALRDHYADLVDPGNWIRWVVENAPRRFAQEIVELEHFGALANLDSLLRLIRFHDRKRLYPRELLLPKWRDAAGIVTIPDYLTIAQARKIAIMLQGRRRGDLIRECAASHRRRFLQLKNADGPDWREAWALLDERGRRSVVALAALMPDRAMGESICPDAIAEQWPLLQTPLLKPAFVWHPRVGLAFVGKEHVPASTLRLWLVDHRRRTRNPYDLRFWRSVECGSENPVREIEALAFGEIGTLITNRK